MGMQAVLGKVRTGFLNSGHLGMALGCSVFATSSLLIRYIDLPAQTIVFYRFAFAVLGLLLFGLPVDLMKGIQTTRDKWLVVSLGVVATVSFVSFVVALQYTSVANANLLFFVSPVVTPFLADKLLGERISKLAIMALVLAILGVFVVGYPELQMPELRDSIGMAMAFGGGFFASLSTVLRKMVDKSVPSYVITVYRNVVTAMCTLPLMLFTRGSFEMNSITLSLLAILGIVNTGLAGLLTVDAMGKIKAQDAAVLRYAEPLGAILLAWVFLSELPSIYTVVGGGLILLAGYMVVWQGETSAGICETSS